MMKRKIFLLCAALIGVVLLASCASHDNSQTSKAHNAVTSSDKNNSSNADKMKDKQAGKENTDSNDQSSDKPKEDQYENDHSKAEAGTSNGSDENQPANLSNQLKMNDTNIKLPAIFPVNGNVTPTIRKNTPSVYSIDYRTNSNKDVASFTGTLYHSADEAKHSVDEFMNGKTVPKRDDTATDLGHGIEGYGEGTAGHAHFGWKEGNWTMSITSVSADKMDNPAIARKMVDYLESHSLPAPKDKGMVFVNYPNGGNSVNVAIRWQENKMVYQLKTSEVPLDALKMAVSVK